ncbi:MAG: secretion protein HlyD family protein [Myxococcales bacterium]|nr:secretion protein HlyD family protein [Myxococcales bacterium]
MPKLLAVLIPVALFVGSFTSARAEPTPSKAPARIEVRVTKKGFEPDNITVPARTPITLVFLRTTEATCTKSVVLALDGDKKIERELPLDKPVEIAVTFPRSGRLGYACSMNMTKGTIIVQ